MMTDKADNDALVRSRYLSDRFDWAAPGDQQKDVWLLRFCDNDVRDAMWTGPDAEAEAWAAWNRHAPGYNCYLFRLAALRTPQPDETETLRAEVARLREALVVADDAIKEMFRYYDGGETHGSYDGKPERNQLRKAGYATSAALKGTDHGRG